ncbi:hypothetical protein [Pseudomonas lactucae]|uniref:Uncharacterized protein n=1 Tax=Pseudomonas lactucae TaxID=2813360 RepID=A0A9X0Y9R3_9PSED|nr:hypothetical protein [Pseudomonas lactucae]MBN2976123.1 hypothetical protein [Pseudomonas lactucae]MBN2989783.1 hypothetical protein [Pseudomonas lactucae]
MAKQKQSTSKPSEPNAIEVAAPVIYKGEDGTLYPLDVKDGPYLTTDSRMDGSPITVQVRVKDADEPVFADIVDLTGSSGSRDIAIPLDYLSAGMGRTLLFSYSGVAGGQYADSLVTEVAVRFYDEVDLEGYVPKFVHSKLVHNTPTLDMNTFEGDETILAYAHPLVKAGDQLFVNVAGDQDQTPFAFHIVAYAHVVTAAEAIPGGVISLKLSRGWMARRRPWGSLTIHWGWICDGTQPQPPADVDPIVETRLPANALEGRPRPTSALIVAPGLQNLPPPHLRQSVECSPGQWTLNPLLTPQGGDVDATYPDITAGDRVCFSVKSVGYRPQPLGCVTVKAGESSVSVKLAPEIIARFFDKSLTLTYDVSFNGNPPQPSPEREVKVLAPHLTTPDIEEATAGVVDLNTFPGNAIGVVPIWDYAREGDCCWMWGTGLLEDGDPYRFDVLMDEPLTAKWLRDGVDTPMPRSELKKLADCSDFELHFAASFDWRCDRATAIEFPTRRFNIVQENLVLRAPTVTEAVGNDLTAWNGRNGVHVEVDYLGNSDHHTLAVCWKKPNGACWPLETQSGSTSGPVSFVVPREAVIESIGKTVDIDYTVSSACKQATADVFKLSISVPHRLPTPVVPQATPPAVQGGILDLRTFKGDADIVVYHDEFSLAWWFALAGQKIWLQGVGTKWNGEPHTFDVLKGKTITSDEAESGVWAVLDRAELRSLKDESELTFLCKVTPDESSHERDAVAFPSLRLILRDPLESESDNFEGYSTKEYLGPPSLIETRLLDLELPATSPRGIGIHVVRGKGEEVPGMVEGRSLALRCGGPDQLQLVTLRLKKNCERIKFAYSGVSVESATFTFFDQNNNVLETRDVVPPSWVDFQDVERRLVTHVNVVSRMHGCLDSLTIWYRPEDNDS